MRAFIRFMAFMIAIALLVAAFGFVISGGWNIAAGIACVFVSMPFWLIWIALDPDRVNQFE